jgi:hypothetical protein
MQPRSVHLLQFSPPPPPAFVPSGKVLTNPSVVIDGHDISTQVISIQFASSVDLLDITLLGDAYHRMAPGLIATTFSMEYYHEYGASSIDTILEGLLPSTGFTIVVMPDRARAVAVDNPTFTATYTMVDYQRFAAHVGAASTGTVTFTASTVVTLATS